MAGAVEGAEGRAGGELGGGRGLGKGRSKRVGRGAKRPAPAQTSSLGGNPTQSIINHEIVKPWNRHC